MDPVTMVPIQMKMIEPSLLTEAQVRGGGMSEIPSNYICQSTQCVIHLLGVDLPNCSQEGIRPVQIAGVRSHQSGLSSDSGPCTSVPNNVSSKIV